MILPSAPRVICLLTALISLPINRKESAAPRLPPLRRTMDLPFEKFIRQAAEENRVDPRLIAAIIWTESGFNARDVSPAGACGLMQLMPQTARMLGVKDVFDPQANIRAGTRHFRHLLNQYSGDLALALAAYNAGDLPVRRYHGIPPFPETRNYVKKVLRHYPPPTRVEVPNRYGHSGQGFLAS